MYSPVIFTYYHENETTIRTTETQKEKKIEAKKMEAKTNQSLFTCYYIIFITGFNWLIFGVLTPLLAIFQLYHGDQF